MTLLTRFALSSTLSKRWKQQPPGLCIHRIVIIKRGAYMLYINQFTWFALISGRLHMLPPLKSTRSRASRYGYTLQWDNQRMSTCIHIKHFIWSALVPRWFYMLFPSKGPDLQCRYGFTSRTPTWVSLNQSIWSVLTSGLFYMAFAPERTESTANRD